MTDQRPSRDQDELEIMSGYSIKVTTNLTPQFNNGHAIIDTGN